MFINKWYPNFTIRKKNVYIENYYLWYQDEALPCYFLKYEEEKFCSWNLPFLGLWFFTVMYQRVRSPSSLYIIVAKHNNMFKDMLDVMEPRFYQNENQAQGLLLLGIPDEHIAHIRALVAFIKNIDYISKLYSSQSLLTSATKCVQLCNQYCLKI